MFVSAIFFLASSSAFLWASASSFLIRSACRMNFKIWLLQSKREKKPAFLFILSLSKGFLKFLNEITAAVRYAAYLKIWISSNQCVTTLFFICILACCWRLTKLLESLITWESDQTVKRDLYFVLIHTRSKRDSFMRTSRLACRSLSCSARILCCSARSARRFSWKHKSRYLMVLQCLLTEKYHYIFWVHSVINNWDAISQFSPWELWVPLLPSSCTQSEHRSVTAALQDLCFDVSFGYPVRQERHEAAFINMY